MRWMVSLDKEADSEAFAAVAWKKKVHAEKVGGLRRHFIVWGSEKEIRRLGFPISSMANADDEKLVRGQEQVLVLDKFLTDAQWALARTIRRAAPWNVDRMVHPITTFYEAARDGAGVDIYWLDTGVRTSHDEFGGRASTVWEYVDHGGDPDQHGHGTRQAANAAGETLGFARGASLFSFNIETSEGGGTASATSLIAALGEVSSHYASRSGLNRPAVLNCSFTPGFTGPAADAVSDVMDDGMVVCWSAGNTGESVDSAPPFYVASVADIILSGGTSAADLPLNNSLGGSSGEAIRTNVGTEVDIMSPGSFVRSALISGDSAYGIGAGGTSAASAFTAGVVACMLEGHDRLTTRTEVQAVRAALLANATTGKFRAEGLTLPDRILYLDPAQTAPETISGL